MKSKIFTCQTNKKYYESKHYDKVAYTPNNLGNEQEWERELKMYPEQFAYVNSAHNCMLTILNILVGY